MGTFYEGFDIAFWVDNLTLKEFNCSTLLLIAVTNLFLLLQSLRLILFLLQDSTVFSLFTGLFWSLFFYRS